MRPAVESGCTLEDDLEDELKNKTEDEMEDEAADYMKDDMEEEEVAEETQKQESAEEQEQDEDRWGATDDRPARCEVLEPQLTALSNVSSRCRFRERGYMPLQLLSVFVERADTMVPADIMHRAVQSAASDLVSRADELALSRAAKLAA